VTIRVALAGADGRMGRVVGPGLEAEADLVLVARIEVGDDYVAAVRSSRAEVVVDFTTPDAAVANARRILAAGAWGVIGTTGFTPRDLDALDAEAKAAKRGLLVAPNFAVGAVLAQRFAAEAARRFARAEIVEMHHDGKKDAPSGTALRTAESMGLGAGGGGPEGGPARGLVHEGVRVHSVRLPGLVAHQEVLFGGAGELLTIRHDALSRECYVPGVVLGIRAVRGRVGVLRGLESVLFP
jgi:4-hydroxy-tetrahydrodipicolinate reductase